MRELGLRAVPGYLAHELLSSDLVSATYLAERESDGYPVFLQVISEASEDGAAVDAFFASLERVTHIKHPVLPDVWDVGRTGDVLYSVTSAVEGRSLASALRATGCLPVHDTLAICSELADALDTLHAADVVHGAINPHTVWINDRARAPSAPWVTLRGYGTAPLLSHRVSAERLDPPPADVLYIAPEQLKREELTGRVDQYALACMVVHCLTGAPPFERATVNALVGAHLFAAPRSGDAAWDVLQPNVVDAVQRAMAKEPAYRFALCSAFATAIGGDAQRSWTWMIQEALASQVAPGAHSESELSSVPPTDEEAELTAPVSDATVRRDRTVRSFAEADWLPGTAEPATVDRSGPRSQWQPRVARPSLAPAGEAGSRVTRSAPAGGLRPPTAAGAATRQQDSWPRVAPEPLTGRRPQVLLWIAVACATLLMVAVVATLLTRSSNETALTDEQRAQRTAEQPPAEIVPAWQRTVARQPVAALLDTGEVLVSGGGEALNVMDPASGRSRWDATIGSRIVDLTTLGGVVVVRTTNALYGFDERTGRRLWNTADDTPASIPAAAAAGRTALYEVVAGDQGLVIRARAPRTGAVEWTIDDLAGARGDTSAVYDSSRLGGQMLYVLNGSRLHAIDTAEQRPRWQITLDRPDVGSLTASAKAIVVTSANGEICRYGMQDGDAVWTECATLDSAAGTRAAIRTRNARVIVRSAREVAAVDFTSGVSHWRVTDDGGFADAFAANADMAFVAHADGRVEAIDHQRGVERWRSGPVGDITAMTASGDAVYVATASGQVTRFDASSPTTAP